LAVIQRSAFCDEGSLFDFHHAQPLSYRASVCRLRPRSYHQPRSHFWSPGDSSLVRNTE
jgi:hypothetical protein